MEKNSTKMSLATAVCIIIIFLLIVALIFVYLQNEKRTKDLEDKIALLESQQTVVPNDTNTDNITIEEKIQEIEGKNDNNTNAEYKLLTSAEIDEILKPDAATFCIEDIKQSGDDYIIYAIMLEDTPRKLTDAEYNSLLNGGKIEFRNQKWEMSSDNEYDVWIKSGESVLSVNKDTKIIENSAGAVARLCDYSEQKIAFKVSKDILIGAFFSEFKYDANGEIHAYLESSEEMIDDFEGMSFERLLEISIGGTGYYDECVAYVRNGVVDAIRINYK